jgi:hypothetical protein
MDRRSRLQSCRGKLKLVMREDDAKIEREAASQRAYLSGDPLPLEHQAQAKILSRNAL